jgi:hypothetical protein
MGTFAAEKGLYLSYATVAQLNYPIGKVHSALKKLAKAHGEGFVLREDVEIALSDVEPLLHRVHEYYHHAQLTSTPVGMLIWRVMNAIIAAVVWLVRKISEETDFVGPTFPISKWLSDPGVTERLIHFLPEHERQYTIELVAELESLIAFIESFLGHPSITLGEFIRRANRATPEIMAASDLRPEYKWSTKYDEGLPYLSDEHFSVTQVLEAGARLHELRAITGIRNSPDLIKMWKQNSLFGDYRPAFMFVIDRLGDVDMAAAAIDLALNTPVDLVVAPAIRGQLLVEDVHPGWRLPRIVSAMEETFWNSDSAGQAKFAHDVMARARLCQPKKIAHLVVNEPINGPRSWSADEKLLGRPVAAPFQVFIDYVELEFRTNAARRFANPICVTSGLDAVGMLNRPPLEYYGDRAALFFTPIVKQLGRPELHHLLYMFTVLGDAALAFVADGDVSKTIPKYQSCFVAGIEWLRKTKSDPGPAINPEVFNARKIVRANFGRLADSLHWT